MLTINYAQIVATTKIEEENPHNSPEMYGLAALSDLERKRSFFLDLEGHGQAHKSGTRTNGILKPPIQVQAEHRFQISYFRRKPAPATSAATNTPVL